MTYKVLVPISGGKDSQACLKLAMSQYKASEVLGLFCDTKFEHPLTYEHIKNLSKLYGVQIKTLRSSSVPDLIVKKGRFPSFQARFCTSNLKIDTGKKFYHQLAKSQGGFEVWYGMRLEESPARRKRYSSRISNETYQPHEFMRKYPKYLGKLGIKFRLPILEWSAKEVFRFLDGEENPLYSKGFSRVGCFPCLASGDSEKDKAFNFDKFGRAQHKKVIWLESQIGKSVYNRDHRGPGCSVCAI